MIVLDTNVLLYAFRGEFEQSAGVRAWLQEQRIRSRQLFVPALVASAFVRLATRSLGPLQPAPIRQVITFIDTLAALSPPEPRLLSRTALALCERLQLAGDKTIDAWIAAYAVEWNCALASHDQGFARYAPELKWIDPLTA